MLKPDQLTLTDAQVATAAEFEKTIDEKLQKHHGVAEISMDQITDANRIAWRSVLIRYSQAGWHISVDEQRGFVNFTHPDLR